MVTAVDSEIFPKSGVVPQQYGSRDDSYVNRHTKEVSSRCSTTTDDSGAGLRHLGVDMVGVQCGLVVLVQGFVRGRGVERKSFPSQARRIQRGLKRLVFFQRDVSVAFNATNMVKATV